MKRLTPLKFVLLLALSALACNALTRRTQPPAFVDTLVGAVTETPPMVSGNSAGRADAPVKMVEFADYQCPFCQRFWKETQAQVIENYVATGKLQYTVRSAGNWVSGNISASGVESQNSAMAAYCAMDQDKFWQMHDALFAAVKGEEVGSFAPDRLRSIAQGIGLDMQAFNACLTGEKYLKQVNQDYQDAKSLGIQGVPFFVITYSAGGETKTQRIDGAQPFGVFQAELDAAVSAASGR